MNTAINVGWVKAELEEKLFSVLYAEYVVDNHYKVNHHWSWDTISFYIYGDEVTIVFYYDYKTRHEEVAKMFTAKMPERPFYVKHWIFPSKVVLSWLRDLEELRPAINEIFPQFQSAQYSATYAILGSMIKRDTMLATRIPPSVKSVFRK